MKKVIEEALAANNYETALKACAWDAEAINAGACNPTAISGALHDAMIVGMRVTGANVREVVRDHTAYAPARLILHQLCFVCGLPLEYSMEKYIKDVEMMEGLQQGVGSVMA